jgi:repressor LexA
VVIVDKRTYAENGEIVVALIEDEATVKTFYKEDGHYRLQPENKTMEPIISESVAILGKVVASLRLY